jgi:hypothetical protein
MSMYAMIELSRSGVQQVPAEMYPKKEREKEDLMYGHDLAKAPDNGLDALCTKAGVKPISAFFDDTAMLDDEEREELGLPPAKPKWAPIEEGLRTVRALIAALTAKGASEDELWDLRVSEQILSSAEGSGEKFHLQVL